MPRRLPAVLAVLVLAVSLGCVHTKAAGTSETLRQAHDTFFRFLRWGPDLRGAAQVVLPERQKGWLDNALDGKSDEDLKVTDSEIDDLKLLPDGTATTVTKLTWHRLPSTTTKTERVTVEWVDKNGTWFAAAITGGPLPLTGLAPAGADAGTAAPAEKQP